MKKQLAVILCLALLASMSACAGSAAPEASETANMLRSAEAVSEPALEAPAAQVEKAPVPQITETAGSALSETATPAESVVTQTVPTQAQPAPTAPTQAQPAPTAPTQAQPTPTATPETEPQPTAPPETEPPQTVGYGGVDIDLTMYSSTMLFSQTYNMLVDPTPYLGQIVRMRGSYIVYSDGARACLISDEGGCCQEGIHFSLQEGIPYPDLGTQVTVVGIFGTYYLNGVLYCRLYNAILE